MQLSFQLCKRQISVFRRLLDELYCNYYRKQRLLSVAHVCVLPVADPEILRGGGGIQCLSPVVSYRK